jgi:hypothetical protein
VRASGPTTSKPSGPNSCKPRATRALTRPPRGVFNRFLGVRRNRRDPVVLSSMVRPFPTHLKSRLSHRGGQRKDQVRIGMGLQARVVGLWPGKIMSEGAASFCSTCANLQFGFRSSPDWLPSKTVTFAFKSEGFGHVAISQNRLALPMLRGNNASAKTHPVQAEINERAPLRTQWLNHN